MTHPSCAPDSIPSVEALIVLVQVWRDIDVFVVYQLSRICSRLKKTFQAFPAYWRALAGLQSRWKESFSTIPLLLHSSLCGNDPQGRSLPRMPVRFRMPDQRVECPEILRRFLVPPLAGSNFNLCRIGFEQMKTMSSSELESAVNAAMEHRVFLIMEGAFELLKTDLEKWLSDRSSSVAQLSGRDRKGELSTELGAYLTAMKCYQKGLANFQYAWSGALGTFTCKNVMLYQEDLLFLETHQVFSKFLPWGAASLLRDDLESEHSLQYGPYLFGGDKMRGSCEAAAKGALSQSECEDGCQLNKRRVRYRGDKKDGLGGSTMHLDGMGSLVAIGGLKSGKKLVTAVEACDAMLAFKIAGFKSYAKPGGSNFLTNDPVDRAFSCEDDSRSLKDLWTTSHVRWGTFEINAGDAYVIPAGIPHEFLNSEPSLSIAWNILPACEQSSAGEPWHFLLLLQALHDAEKDFSGSRDRLRSAIDHAPVPLLVANIFPDIASVANPMHCSSCASKHRKTAEKLKKSGGRAGSVKQENDFGTQFNSSCWECSIFNRSKREKNSDLSSELKSKTPAEHAAQVGKSHAGQAAQTGKCYELPRHSSPLNISPVGSTTRFRPLSGLKLIETLRRSEAPGSLPCGHDLLIQSNGHRLRCYLFEEKDLHVYNMFWSITAVSSFLRGRGEGNTETLCLELLEDESTIQRCRPSLARVHTVKKLFALLSDNKEDSVSRKHKKGSGRLAPSSSLTESSAGLEERFSDSKDEQSPGVEVQGTRRAVGERGGEQQVTCSSNKKRRGAEGKEVRQEEAQGPSSLLPSTPRPCGIQPVRLEARPQAPVEVACSSSQACALGTQTGRERRRLERAKRAQETEKTATEGAVRPKPDGENKPPSVLLPHSVVPTDVHASLPGEGASLQCSQAIVHRSDTVAMPSSPEDISSSSEPHPEELGVFGSPIDTPCASDGQEGTSSKFREFVYKLDIEHFLLLKKHVQSRAAELYRQMVAQEKEGESLEGE
eukprot:756658-Hanusia_phi.AAC.4